MPVAPSQTSPDIAQAPSPQEGRITALRPPCSRAQCQPSVPPLLAAELPDSLNPTSFSIDQSSRSRVLAPPQKPLRKVMVRRMLRVPTGLQASPSPPQPRGHRSLLTWI